MGWWRKRKKKRILERGAMLLEDIIECCDGKSNPIKFFSAHQIRKATHSFSDSYYVSILSVSGYKADNYWYSGEVPTMVEVAKELKKIQRSLNHDSSSSSSGETQFDSPQDVSSLVLLSNQT